MGGQLASFGLDGSDSRLGYLGDGRLIKVLVGQDRWPMALKTHRPATRMVSERSISGFAVTVRLMKIWDVRTGKVLLTVSNPSGWSIAWSPDGKTLATGRGNGEAVTLWNASTGEKIDIIRAQYVDVNQIAWSPSSSKLSL